MKYSIRMIRVKGGQRFYFSHFDDGYLGKNTPHSVMDYRAPAACKKYPSIKSACADVKLIDRSRWRLIIVRAPKTVL